MSNEAPLTREAILDAAEQVLRRYGPDKTSVIDIAKFLNVSHGTLYRHFASKAALRETVTERWLERGIEKPLQEIAESSAGSTAERLRLWFDTLLSKKRSSAAEDAEMFAMYANVTAESVEMVAKHVNVLIGQLAVIVQKGMVSGEFDAAAGTAEDLAKAVFTATSKFHHPAHANEWRSANIDEDFEAVWRLLIQGLE